jgi:hypothetical protein
MTYGDALTLTLALIALAFIVIAPIALVIDAALDIYKETKV